MEYEDEGGVEMDDLEHTAEDSDLLSKEGNEAAKNGAPGGIDFDTSLDLDGLDLDDDEGGAGEAIRRSSAAGDGDSDDEIDFTEIDDLISAGPRAHF